MKERPHRRRDEDLGVAHALRRGVVDVVARDAGEVFGVVQRLADFREERAGTRESREGVRFAGSPGEALALDAVQLGQFTKGCGAHRPLEVAVQLDFGQGANERRIDHFRQIPKPAAAPASSFAFDSRTRRRYSCRRPSRGGAVR